MAATPGPPVVLGLVGDSGVGKRSLTLCYKSKQPTSANSPVESVKGVDIDGVAVRVLAPSGLASGDKFVFQTLDVLILVYALDAPQTFASLEKLWTTELKADKRPIILVGSKSDKKPKVPPPPVPGKPPLPDGQILMKNVGAVAYYTCSSWTRENVDTLFAEAIAAGKKSKRMPKQVTARGGVFSNMFRKSAAIFPDANDGVEINNDTDAADLKNVCFPLRQIPEKWLFHVDEYLKPQKDRGPSSALHGALCCLKNLYYMEGAEWASVRDKEIIVGLIKATSDCGNSSVSMGLAWVYFKLKQMKNQDNQALALINCGTGGVRFQLYIKHMNVVSCLLEYKPPGGGKGVLGNLKCGSYVPKQQQTSEQIIEEIKQGLAMAPWQNPKLRIKMAKQFGLKGPEQLKVPVIAYVTGTIRNHWESKATDAKDADTMERAINGILESVLGKDSYLTSILGVDRKSYLIKQRLEGQMELVGIRGLYSQYGAATGASLVGAGPPQGPKSDVGRQLEPVISLGIGKGSTQWTTLDPNFPDDFSKYILEPEIKYGMDADDLGERLGSAIVTEFSGKTESLARLMMSVFKRGHIPVIALKSGCLLNLDDAREGKDGGPSGKERREHLVQLGSVVGGSNTRPKEVIFARRSGERTVEMLGTMSVSVACAWACKTLALPGEDPLPQFIKVRVEGTENFLTRDDLQNIKTGTTLMFLTSADLWDKTVAGPPKPMPPRNAAEVRQATKRVGLCPIICEGPLKRKDKSDKAPEEKYFVLTTEDLNWHDHSRDRLTKPPTAAATLSLAHVNGISRDANKFEIELGDGWTGNPATLALEASTDVLAQKWVRRITRLLSRRKNSRLGPDRSTDDEVPQEEKKAAPLPPKPKGPPPPLPASPPPAKPAAAPIRQNVEATLSALLGELDLQTTPEMTEKASVLNALSVLDDEDPEEPTEDPDPIEVDDLPPPGDDSDPDDVPAVVPLGPPPSKQKLSLPPPPPPKESQGPTLASVLSHLGLSESLSSFESEEYILSDILFLSEGDLTQVLPSKPSRVKLLTHLNTLDLPKPHRSGDSADHSSAKTQEACAGIPQFQKKMASLFAQHQTQMASLGELQAKWPSG